MHKKPFILLLLISSFIPISHAQNNTYSHLFKQWEKQNWQLAFQDKCTENWQQNWDLDGEKTVIKQGVKGMDIFAGETPWADADHTVLWTKQSFAGDLKITYDFTRLDTVPHFVNIIYIQASGNEKGAYTFDISTWQQQRKIPAMDIYFNHMNLYHISYAVSGAPEGAPEYVRARRYMPDKGIGLKNTALTPEYSHTGLFLPQKTYRITIIKIGREICMQVSPIKKGNASHTPKDKSHNPKIQQNKSSYFYFDATAFPPITEGKVGFRQMCTRNSRYANVKIYTRKY